MQHWSQLAFRAWWVWRLRTAGATAAIALGVAAVVWVTCCFESVRTSILEWAEQYVGDAHVSVESPLGREGQISESLKRYAEQVDGVERVTAVLHRRLQAKILSADDVAADNYEKAWRVRTDRADFMGVDPGNEAHFRDWSLSDGRMLTPDDGIVCVVEAGVAAEKGCGVGDFVVVWAENRSEPYALEIVGLLDRRRLARYQKPLVILPLRTLQRIDSRTGQVTTIDIVASDVNPESIQKLAINVRNTLARKPFGAHLSVRDALARMRQIENAQSQQEFVLVLMSCVALLTALFIILSTLSMGMVERIAQLGLLRCVGVTRWQLAAMMLLEVAPLGVIGVALGVPAGLGLAALSVQIAPEYVGEFRVSGSGILLAIVAGLGATLVAALIPTLAAVGVSPLEAARPRARRPQRFWLVLVAVFGAALVAVQAYIVNVYAMRSPEWVGYASASVVLLYVGYACLAPLVVWLVGSTIVHLAAALLRVRVHLLQDQVGHAVWRSTGICCGLMVGLSLIVGLVVFSNSFQQGWQFPKQFPAAYLWSPSQVRPQQNDVDEQLATISGVGAFTSCNMVNVKLIEQSSLFGTERLFSSLTWFVGCDPDRFPDLVQLEYLEGDEGDAMQKLRQGGYVIIAEDFANSRNKRLGDMVTVYYGDRPYQFEVAAVVTSPALDIAANYFQLRSQMSVAASGTVLGSNADLERLFNLRGRRLVLLNFALSDAPPPVDWPPPRDTEEGAALAEKYYDPRIPLDARWRRYREDQVLLAITKKLSTPAANFGTIAELKDEIDRQLSAVTRLLAAAPAIALLVAALGVANLMSANVASRSKQIAIMRAVGATRGLVLRLVIGEAIVLGLLGGLLGVALGLHLAHNTTRLTGNMWGFDVAFVMPWPFVFSAAAATILLCVIAGLWPARRAARNDVVQALHVA